MLGVNDNPASPAHVGIIMDGNRRWAKRQGLPVLEGHRRGVETLRQITEHAFNSGVKYLTMFAFSKENWQRQPEEVNYLMSLFLEVIDGYSRDCQRQGLKLKFLGQVADFSSAIQEKIKQTELKTAAGERGQLSLAFGYGGWQEIADAVEKLMAAKSVARPITPAVIRDYLYDGQLPDLDLVIRTSGEYRTSGFMLWQAAYAELYFTLKMWPEFTPADFNEAIAEYRQRQRRFGK